MRTLTILVTLLVLTACVQTEDGIILRTADPNLSVFMPVAPGEVGVDMPVPIPEPPCTLVKANINQSGDKIAHSPGQANYDTVKIDEAAGEKFFCSLEDAVAAGWRPALR